MEECRPHEEITIWTIGHSTRSAAALIEILDAHGIKVLADVRRYPSSRRHPQFNATQLASALAEAGIEYTDFREMGGWRKPRPDSPNTAWRSPGFRGYADYMETDAFRQAVTRLLALARRKSTAIMCAEALWWHCHRMLISDYLKAQGVTVIHIFDKEKTELHPFTREARLVEGKLCYTVPRQTVFDF